MIRLVLRLALSLLPSWLRPWGEAAARETMSIDRPGAALVFALGFLVWASRAAVTARRTAPTNREVPYRHEDEPMRLFENLSGPRGAAVTCAAVATGLGLVYMAVGGAPLGYPVINIGAFAFGAAILAILALADRRGHLPAGPVAAALGAVIPLTALWGVSADGVARWITVGPVALQPSLIVLPLMILLFGRSRDILGLIGVALAAAGLALQPDRGMAGALAAGLGVLAAVRPGGTTTVAAALACVALIVTLARADPSPAVPYVDQILFTSFAVHPLIGAAVVLGAGLLIVPALAGLRGAAEERAASLVFGATWAAVVAAAALGNFPTPLVGYGGSAIIGYLISLAVLPRRATKAMAASDEQRDEAGSDRPALLATAS